MDHAVPNRFLTGEQYLIRDKTVKLEKKERLIHLHSLTCYIKSAQYRHYLFYQIIQAQIMTHFVMLDRVQQNEDSIIINKLRHALD